MKSEYRIRMENEIQMEHIREKPYLDAVAAVQVCKLTQDERQTILDILNAHVREHSGRIMELHSELAKHERGW